MMFKSTKCRALLIAVLLPLGLWVRPVWSAEGGPKSPYAGIDAEIQEAAGTLAALERKVHLESSTSEPRAACRASFSLAAELASGALSKGGPKVGQSYVLYQVCQSLAAGNTSVCSSMGAPRGSDAQCRDLYWRLVRSRLLITAASDPAGAKRACLEMFLNQKDLGFSGDPSMFCDLYVGNADDAHRRVAKISPLANPPLSGAGQVAAAEVSERNFMGLGDSQTCSAENEWISQQGCMAARSYRASYFRKDPGACGKSGLCRVLMGQGLPHCSVYLDLLSDQACATTGVAGRNAATDERKDMSQSALQLQNRFMALVGELEGVVPRRAAEFDSRKAKIMALHARSEGLVRTLMGPNAASTKAEAAKAPR